MNYTQIIKTGHWLNKIDTKAPSIEITQIDWANEQVILPDESRLKFDVFLSAYELPPSPYGDTGSSNNVLGELPKEADLMQEEWLSNQGGDSSQNAGMDSTAEALDRINNPEKYVNKDIPKTIQPVHEQPLINTLEPTQVHTKTVQIVDTDTAEYRMISDALTLASKSDDKFTFDIPSTSVDFDFDLAKIANIVSMFDMDYEKACDILISTESGFGAMKSILEQILHILSNKEGK